MRMSQQCDKTKIPQAALSNLKIINAEFLNFERLGGACIQYPSQLDDSKPLTNL